MQDPILTVWYFDPKLLHSIELPGIQGGENPPGTVMSGDLSLSQQAHQKLNTQKAEVRGFRARKLVRVKAGSTK